MNISDNKMTCVYHQEDIQQILQIAISRQAHEGEFTREQLVEIAAELEITPECLQAAEREWQLQQADLHKREAFNMHRRRNLQKSFGNYAIVNSFFLLLNFISAGELSWSLYIALFWGVGLALNTWNTFQTQGEEYEKAYRRWYRSRQIKQSVNSLVDRCLKAWQI
ncbi:hypothetical protein NIES1031_12815 [Chroogloeocystis siderophila 5.2 s.c.1]|jgi:hypothetical protein|uniref:2TM domain-containing protein n=2 Tax=Chroogloeocystis TaxID=329162 RepID=A0A1U7HQJ1_9CHRO|nr:hypothetical protein NIES1031_12815 [Chroogloeocystis siderophila 5.2 s.c.1]